MRSIFRKIRAFSIAAAIITTSALFAWLLIETVQLQHHILPAEQRVEQSYIQRTANLKKERALRDHFHIIVEEQNSRVEEKSVCFFCHTTLPHHKNKKVRAMLNMHTYFLTCQTCHVKKSGGQEVEYGWLDPAGADLAKGHYGTSYHEFSGSLIRQNIDSRIAPIVRENAKTRFLVQETDTPLAIDYLAVKDTLKEKEKDFAKKGFHEGIEPVGWGCSECHSKDGRLDFERLGFDEKRRNDLENLSISGMMTRYETFFLPDLFK